MIEDRIKRYWTRRAHDFSTVRKNELKNHLRVAWLQELSAHLPTSSPIRALDIGTGSGFFSILLAKEGISVEGIDLTVLWMRKILTMKRKALTLFSVATSLGHCPMQKKPMLSGFVY